MSGAKPKGAPAAPSTPKAKPQAAPQATPQPAPQPAAKVKSRHPQKVGRVVSDKMEKTIVVAVESLKRHPLYKRTYKSTARFKAHDETNDARLNDTVLIEETRPLSKDKRWRLVEIIKRGVQTTPVAQVVAELAPDLAGFDDEDEE